eukprot:11334587-Alexandrium_andersonii.AAC.1
MDAAQADRLIAAATALGGSQSAPPKSSKVPKQAKEKQPKAKAKAEAKAKALPKKSDAEVLAAVAPSGATGAKGAKGDHSNVPRGSQPVKAP